MGKKDVDASREDEEEESTVVLSPIANPLAKDKLVKKILKLVKAGENGNLARCLLRCQPLLRGRGTEETLLSSVPLLSPLTWFLSPPNS